MAIYKITALSETNPKHRLVAANNKNQALSHIAGKLFTVEAVDAEEVAELFVNGGVTAVEKAGNGGE